MCLFAFRCHSTNYVPLHLFGRVPCFSACPSWAGYWIHSDILLLLFVLPPGCCGRHRRSWTGRCRHGGLEGHVEEGGWRRCRRPGHAAVPLPLQPSEGPRCQPAGCGEHLEVTSGSALLLGLHFQSEQVIMSLLLKVFFLIFFCNVVLLISKKRNLKCVSHLETCLLINTFVPCLSSLACSSFQEVVRSGAEGLWGHRATHQVILSYCAQKHPRQVDRIAETVFVFLIFPEKNVHVMLINSLHLLLLLSQSSLACRKRWCTSWWTMWRTACRASWWVSYTSRCSWTTCWQSRRTWLRDAARPPTCSRYRCHHVPW